MAESILVTGKKISSMELITNVNGNEKIPTGQPEDLAITPNQIKDFTIEQGSLVNQTTLNTEVSNLSTSISNNLNQAKGYTDTKVDAVSAALDEHKNDQSNPHDVTKEQVGLDRVDNTNDLEKPISTQTQTALDLKANIANTYSKSEVDNKLTLKLDTTANAVSASKWQTPRVFQISGDVTGNVTLDGSSDITINVQMVDTGVPEGQYTKVSVNSKGQITAGTSLVASDIPTLNQNTTGNSATADKWKTPRTLSFTGAATGSASIDGSTDQTIPLTLNAPTVRAFIRYQTSNGGLNKNLGFSSVTKISNGFYRFVMSNPAPDSNYIVSLTGSHSGGDAGSINLDENFPQTTTTFQVRCTYGGDNSSGVFNPAFINAVIHY